MKRAWIEPSLHDDVRAELEWAGSALLGQPACSVDPTGDRGQANAPQAAVEEGTAVAPTRRAGPAGSKRPVGHRKK